MLYQTIFLKVELLVCLQNLYIISGGCLGVIAAVPDHLGFECRYIGFHQFSLADDAQKIVDYSSLLIISYCSPVTFVIEIMTHKHPIKAVSCCLVLSTQIFILLVLLSALWHAYPPVHLPVFFHLIDHE